MELWEDKIIKNKLDSLDTLPEGYEPNLNSKWSLLEAGLEGNKRKIALGSWYKIVAMLLLIGGGSFLLIKLQQQKAKTALQSEKMALPIVINEDKKTVDIETKVIPVKSNQIAHQKKTKASHATQTILPDKIEEKSIMVKEVADTFTTQSIALVKQKRARYTEIDFNDQPIGPNVPSESVLAAQQFRFKIGRNSYSSVGSSQGNSLKLRKTLFN